MKLRFLFVWIWFLASFNSASRSIFAEDIFLKGSTLQRIVGDGTAGEGPTWDKELGLLTSGNGDINQWLNGKTRIYRKDSGTNGLRFDAQGRLIACEQKYKRVTRQDRNGKIEVLADSFEGHPFNSPNDLSIDSKGRIYFSDPRYGEKDGMEQLDSDGKTIEGVYRIDTDGKIVRVLGREVERANGVLVSKDDEYLFVADNNNNTLHGARKLWRFKLRDDGSVEKGSQKEIFHWKEGRGPDGLKQDEVGNLYVAGGLNRSNPPFEPDATVRAGIYVLDQDGKQLCLPSRPNR